MCNIDSFKIDLKALPQGITEKEFKLTNEYFEAIDAPDVQDYQSDIYCLHCLRTQRPRILASLCFYIHHHVFP